ncbi:MAG: hypothetical protein IAC61_02675 [Firmicutes bacterium]|uniref:Uncharacterized protein n=1 Tax=Candidatus Alloenteromonas pullistercoris TaxID=2840785 RepID=A0A9D9DGH6_9FIRM|nr:hypothetical protein [Candidatus Enteromonas pullistercoris]
MRHKLKIGVLKGAPRDMVVSCKKARLSKKLTDKLFGRRDEVVIIVLGVFVGEVAITEVGGEAVGRMSDPDISMEELGQDGAEVEIYEDFGHSRRVSKRLQFGHPMV